MPADRLIYWVVAAPVLLLTMFFFTASPFYAAFAFLSSAAREVRARAGWLLLAWLGMVLILALYFLSGWWYAENTAIRPVSSLELAGLLGLVVIGVLLPGIPFWRLVAARRK